MLLFIKVMKHIHFFKNFFVFYVFFLYFIDMQKHTIRIDEDVYDEISEYCKLNGLNVSSFCNGILKNAIKVEKYGDIPFGKVKNITIQQNKPAEETEKPSLIKIESTKPVETNTESTENEPKVTVKKRKL